MNHNLYFAAQNINHNTFGGLISLSDFDTSSKKKKTNPKGSHVAGRIIADWSFDEQCRKNITNNIGNRDTTNRI